MFRLCKAQQGTLVHARMSRSLEVNMRLEFLDELEKLTGICISKRELSKQGVPSNQSVLGQFSAHSFSKEDREYIFLNENCGGYSFHTLFHELAHASGVTYRLNRVSLTCTNDKNYALEELVAETVAKMLLEHYGLNTEATQAYHDQYLTHWSNKIIMSRLYEDYLACEIQRAFLYVKNNWLDSFIFNDVKEKQAILDLYDRN